MRTAIQSINTMHIYFRYICVALLLLAVLLTKGWTIGKPLGDKVIAVSFFSEMDVSDWREKTFSGNTQYEIIKSQDKYVLQATANMSASALYKPINVNLRETPYLNWSWAIKSALPVLNEQSKQGDDYAARIYVLIKTGLAPWKTRALNYVWSSNPMPSQAWPNAFTDKAIMIPLRAGKDSTGEWKMEKVNVRDDIKNYLGANVEKINGVAIMTDTDNSGNTAVALYGDLFFSEL